MMENDSGDGILSGRDYFWSQKSKNRPMAVVTAMAVAVSREPLNDRMAAAQSLVGQWHHGEPSPDAWTDMEQVLQAALARPMTQPDETNDRDAKMDPVAVYLLEQLPDLWAKRPAIVAVSWSDMLTRVMDRFAWNAAWEQRNWPRVGVIGVVLALVALGADPDPDRLMKNLAMGVGNKRQREAAPWYFRGADGNPEMESLIRLMKTVRGLKARDSITEDDPDGGHDKTHWTVDVDQLDQTVAEMAAGVAQSLHSTFPHPDDHSSDSRWAVDLGQHGFIQLVGDGRRLPVLFLRSADRDVMKKALRGALYERVSGLLDQVPTDAFFLAAERCLRWTKSPTYPRPGRPWTGEAEVTGAAQEALQNALETRAPMRRFFTGNPQKVDNPLGATRLRQFQRERARLLGWRMHTLGRATSLDDTCRSRVDLFLADVVCNWVPQVAWENRAAADGEVEQKDAIALARPNNGKSAFSAAPRVGAVAVPSRKTGSDVATHEEKEMYRMNKSDRTNVLAKQYEDMLARRRRRRTR
jgi:hypothetical protein